MAGLRLYFTAGESSGDLFAGEVVDALRERLDLIELRAVGGAELSLRASSPQIDVSSLGVLGFSEGIKAYRDVSRISKEIASDIVNFNPDAAILVDSWGLSIRVARKVRARSPSVRLIKLIGPQVWATRAGRAKTLAAHFDHLLCIHDFEVPYYLPHRLKTSIIGHPALGRVKRLQTHEFFADHKLNPLDPLLLILPGSRRAEIERVAPVLIETARRLQSANPALRVCVAPAGSVMSDFKLSFTDLPTDWLLLKDDKRRYEAMSAATLALSCSGTVNTELAVQRTPFITGYIIGGLSWTLLQTFFLRARYITLLNMAADKMVALELLQGAMTPEALVLHSQKLLDDPALRESQCAAQDEALRLMGYGGRPAAALSAEAILEGLNQ